MRVFRVFAGAVLLFAGVAEGVTLPSALKCLTTLGSTISSEPARPVLPVHEGTLVSLTKIGKVAVPKNAKVYLLGEGDEALVYRVVPARGESYVLRLQKPDAFLPLSVYRRKMNFIEEALSDEEGDPLTGENSFRTAACTPTNDPNVMRLTDVRGTDLETLVERYGADSAIGKRLIALFDTRGNDLVKRAPDVIASARSEPVQTETCSGIRYRHPHIVTQVTISGVDTGGLPPVLGLNPKWRNVIVDPVTWDMTIVDPD